jgi:hypothetical protein
MAGCAARKMTWVEIRGHVRFATDSPLEGSGFELSVPRQIGNGFEALSETGPSGYRRRGLIRAVAGFAEYPD